MDWEDVARLLLHEQNERSIWHIACHIHDFAGVWSRSSLQTHIDTPK
jgi:hypothetical protein